MSRTLDILAIEPFFGGLRRDMLNTLSRCSRHRWRVLKLPPRAMARRLTTSAHWFSQQFARDPAPWPDILFTTDALNLADLFRLDRRLALRPAVVYYHCNDLPDPCGPAASGCFDAPHLVSALAATEIWFNSGSHAGAFLASVDSMYDAIGHARHPGAALRAKLRQMPPPVEDDEEPLIPVEASPNTVFVETAGASVELLQAAFDLIAPMKLRWSLITAGQPFSVPVPQEVIAPGDSAAKSLALQRASIFVSGKIAAPVDDTAVRALRAGCRPILPHTGVYPEMLSPELHDKCLYDMSAESLASHLREALIIPRQFSPSALSAMLGDYDVATACLKIDDRLDELAESAAHRREVVHA
jgi:hypothetical protein